MCKYLKRLLEKAANICMWGLLVLVCDTMSVHAEGSMVQLSVKQEIIYSAEETIIVYVNFFDNEMYSENIYLAYHVKDTDGNVLRYESDRYPVVLDENCDATIAVNVNLSDVKSEDGVFILEFDMVDEESKYWFMDRADIDFRTSVVRCETKGFDRLIKYLRQEIADNPITYGVNLLTFLGAIAVIFVWKMNKK